MATLKAYIVISILLAFMAIQETCSEENNRNGGNIKSRRNPRNNCGDSMCYCSFDYATCGVYSNRLTYIPILPAEVTKLDFGDNYLPYINVSSFNNISNNNIEDIGLESNDIVHIERNSFQLLHYLKRLDVSQNPRIEVTALAESFSSVHKSIFEIHLREMDWEYIPQNMFYYLNGSKLETIYFQHNKIRQITFGAFSHLKHLSALVLNNNKIDSLDMSLLGNLTNLYLINNRLSKIPNFCYPKRPKSFFPRLDLLFLNGNLITELTEGSFKCLPRLKTLGLSDNSNILSLGNNFLLPLVSLKKLQLSHIGQGTIDNFAFNSSTVEMMFFKNNYINKFIFDNIEFIFMNCPQLRILSLSNTHLDLSKQEIESLLFPLTRLKELYLDNTKLEAIPRVISKMTSLTTLNLNSNKISSWNGTEIFGRKSEMSLLSLNDNMIFAINDTSFPPLFIKSLKKSSFDLGRNPYSCTCQTVRSVNWFREKANILRGYPDSYQCFSPPEFKGKPLENYNPSEESCAEKNIALLVSVPVSFVCIATLSAIVLTYKCRWRLRYGLYLVRNRYKDYHRIEDSDSFVYTGFVIYSDDDRNWVHNELIHRLEDQEGFRLCIRLRDFDVGKVHVDNIVDNMFLSEKIIIVLSNSFAEDEWCRFQLLLAETKLLKQNLDVLIVLMLDEIHSDCLRASIYKLVADGQYALWSNDETGNNLFWDQIVSQMKRPSNTN